MFKKRGFPARILMIYLDNAATTRIAPEVLEAMMPYLQENYGNAGSVYSLGRKSAEAIATARIQVAGLFETTPEHIIFTSGGSESNSMVFAGVADYLKSIGKTRILSSRTEHSSVKKSLKALSAKGFYTMWTAPDKTGRVWGDFETGELRHGTGLVSMAHINNETGKINNIRQIGKTCYSHNILYHCDCVQSAGIERINADEFNLDFASVSSHKIHGPKGVGALYVRNKDLLSPLIHGGTNQEFGLRGGTENVAGIVGFGKACELAIQNREKERAALKLLRDSFIQNLQEFMNVSDLKPAGIHINGGSFYYSDKILSLRIDSVLGESLVQFMDALGVCISAGSACQSQEQKPSEVLMAQGLTEEQARSTVRISFSSNNTVEEIAEATQKMASAIQILRDEN